MFIVAGANDLEIEGVRDVSSFADLLDAPSVTGPTGLPANAGEPAQSSEPTVAWLKPRGSVESSGLLRQAVRERLVDKVGAEGFESLVFVTAGPVHSAAAAALGLSARRTAVVINDNEATADIEATVRTLNEASVAIHEVVWT